MSQPLRNYLPGFASLIEQIDKRVLVLLRDGRSLFGILRSIDQFANLVLHLAVERIYIGNEYGEIDRGVVRMDSAEVLMPRKSDGGQAQGGGKKDAAGLVTRDFGSGFRSFVQAG